MVFHRSFRLPVTLSIFDAGAGPTPMQVMVRGGSCVNPRSSIKDEGRLSLSAYMLMSRRASSEFTFTTTLACPAAIHCSYHSLCFFLAASAAERAA